MLILWLSLQVIDLSEDNFFSMLTEDGSTRDDLKITDNCTPTDPTAIRELISSAEGSGERVIVSLFILLVTQFNWQTSSSNVTVF